MLEVGAKAPVFELPDQYGIVHTLEEYRGKKVIFGVSKDTVAS